MAKYVKAFFTTLLATLVATACLFCTRFIPEGVEAVFDKWWVIFISIFAMYTLADLGLGLVSKTANGFVCFLWLGIIMPIVYFALGIYSTIHSLLVPLSVEIFSMSSYISMGIAFAIVLFFAIIYGSIKQNGGFARFILIAAIIALIYGVYALFKYLIKDVITVPGFIAFYGYVFFGFYVNAAATYEICENSMETKRMSRLVSLMKNI